MCVVDITNFISSRRRGNYQSYVNMSFGTGAALGAALGGAMAEALGWRWEFGVQIPPLLLCIAVAAVVIPDDIGLKGPRKGFREALGEFDFKGSALLTVSTTSAILGLVSLFLFAFILPELWLDVCKKRN